MRWPAKLGIFVVDIDLGVHYCLSDYALYMFATFHESSGEKPVLISSVHIMCNLVSVSCSCSHSQRTPVIMLFKLEEIDKSNHADVKLARFGFVHFINTLIHWLKYYVNIHSVLVKNQKIPSLSLRLLRYL